MTIFSPNASPSFLRFYFAAAHKEINGGEVGRPFSSLFSEVRQINHGEVRRGWRGRGYLPPHDGQQTMAFNHATEE